MQDPENFEEDVEQQANNPDQKTEPNCGVVIQKCLSELLSIMLYVIMLVTLTTGLIHHIKVGKIYTSLINFGIGLCIDQVKSLPVQFVIYWVIIRRCNKFDSPNFEVWDDESILQGGVELSLFQWMRLQVRNFLDNYYINKLILVMTLFLCAVIFTELAIQEYLDNPEHPLHSL